MTLGLETAFGDRPFDEGGHNRGDDAGQQSSAQRLHLIA